MNAPAFHLLASDIRAERRDEAQAARMSLNLAAEEVSEAAVEGFLGASPKALYAACAVEAIGQIHNDDALVMLAAIFEGMRKNDTHIEQRRDAMHSIAEAVDSLLFLVRRDAE